MRAAPELRNRMGPGWQSIKDDRNRPGYATQDLRFTVVRVQGEYVVRGPNRTPERVRTLVHARGLVEEWRRIEARTLEAS